MNFSDSESDNRIGSVMDDSVEMRAMAIETGNSKHDVESPQAQRYTTTEGWFALPKFSKLSYSELVSYFGFRGVALLVLLKIAALVFFGYLMLASSTTSSDDYSVVGLVSGRPNELREVIRQTSKDAVVAEPKALFTLQTATELIYDGYIEFILSYPLPKSKSSDSSTDGNGWQASKDTLSTVSKYSNIEDIVAARNDGKTVADPLAIDTIDPALVAHRFAEDAEDSGAAQPFSIVLNKFNTVKDHSLIVTDEYAPQLTPLSAAELELWHWTLLQTRGVGFYNSNLMAGASQAHKHVQLIPGDVIWSLRNPDATHALPIDDTIMPRIESGRWRPYPRKLHRSTSGEGSGNSTAESSSKYWYATSLEAKQRFQAGYLHQLPQFDFQHAVAVLLDRSAFVQDPHPLKAYSDYLRRVYEALLLVNGISLSDLETCADADTLGGSAARRLARSLAPSHSQSIRPVSYDTDDLISEGSYKAPKSRGGSTSTSTGGASKRKETPPPRPLDCLRDVGYNVILRPQYMLLVPRGQKDFQGKVNVNGFGFMGMFLAMSEESKRVIKEAGPLEILKAAGRKLTVRCVA